MQKEIIFIINSVQQQRCIKRIDQFIKNGYVVNAYGFSRNLNTTTHPAFDLQVIGHFSNHSSYLERSLLMLRNLIPILWKYRNNTTVCFYFFGLDIALLSLLILGKCQYIYEESDLMHTYIKNPSIRKFLERRDKRIIHRSIQSVFTSEGFYKYHFGNQEIDNVSILPNKLNEKITLVAPVAKKKSNHIRLGFVGSIRYHSLLNFAQVVSTYPQIEFHFWGNVQDLEEDFKNLDEQHTNVYFHGSFINPDDLPVIYSLIDVVVATYDYRYENVRYAEPNKLYEAIYFEVPIVVSCNTFLATKVSDLHIGYIVDPFEDGDIRNFIEGLSVEDINKKSLVCRQVDKSTLISRENEFFDKLNKIEV